MNTQVAVFGGGCFWCTEAVFDELKGIISAMPGYAAGQTENPTYEQVETGKTGHAQVTRVEFDSGQISFLDLLTVFFATHDPTTLNRQNYDIGTQYRSIILYTSDQQRQEAEKYVEKLKLDGVNVVTELKSLDKFYPAEDYHKQYFLKNPERAYCQIIINPKLEKLQQQFGELLKSHSK